MRTVLLALTLLMSVSAFCEDIYIANGNVNLREDYPKFPFYRNAPILGLVKKGNEVIILDEEKIFNYHWLKIIIVGTEEIGWAYNGSIEGTPYFKEKEAN